MKLGFSLRYGITGISKDRDHPVVRITLGGTDNIARFKRWWYEG